MKNKQHPLYPEPGASVLDTYAGLPKMEPPGPLPNRKLSTLEIRDNFVAYEGLGFCIHSLISPEKIADKELAELWKQAAKAMIAIIKKLESARIPRLKKKVKKKLSQRQTNTFTGGKEV